MANKVLKKKCKDDIEQFNTVISIELHDFEASLNKPLSLKYDNNWYKNWSSDDDDNISVSDETTFGFEVLINNIAEGYNSRVLEPDIYLYDWSIPLYNK